MSIDWSKAYTMNDIRRPQNSRREPVMDKEVSKVVGRPVSASDPRLMKLVVEWKKKQGVGMDDLQNDNFMQNPQFLVELKKVFNAS